MKTIGVILARKDSKGLKNKNRLRINKKSLVEIAIDNAKKSKLLDDIVFSSNDNLLITQAKKKIKFRGMENFIDLYCLNFKQIAYW